VGTGQQLFLRLAVKIVLASFARAHYGRGMSKNIFIKIRTTPEEKRAWQDMVRADGLSLSQVMRDYLNERLRRTERRDKEDVA
jgi:hypothetical protein